MKLKKSELFPKGYYQTQFALPEEVKHLVKEEKWQELDNYIRQMTSHDGELFQFLTAFHEFKSIEFIISIRDAQNEWEEDGIWHDDGTRVFAFSLSLTLDTIEGGVLGVRKFGDESFHQIPTPPYGTIIMFLTGVYGFEHKIHRVTKGRRVIIAGWCS